MRRCQGLLILLVVGASGAPAAELPLWEIGVGGGVIQIPDYRGSSATGIYPYPFILPVYRGRSLQADEEGIKGILSETDRLRLDVSVYGNVPVRGDNEARAGMDALDPTLEIGPMLRYKAWKSSNQRQSAIVDLPLRFALSVGDGLDAVGYAVTPRVSYRSQVNAFGRPWRWSFSGEALWGSSGLHRYFYQVDPADATSWRPAYQAEAGFGGTRFRASLNRRDPDRLVSFYAVYDNVRGAVFEDSPLVERRDGWTLGFVVTWLLFRSDDLVKVRQWEWNTE